MLKQIVPYLASASIIFTPLNQGLSQELSHNNHSIEQHLNNDSSRCSSQSSSLTQKYQNIKHFIENDEFKKKKAYPSNEWKMIAFSNIAEGIVNYTVCNKEKRDEGKELLEKIIDYSLGEGYSYGKIDEKTNLRQDGIYLSHLNILLGAYAELVPDKKYFEIHTKVTDYLAQESLMDTQAHVHSYAKLLHKWPADQAATLYSIFLYDQIYGTKKSVEPIEKWFAYIKKDATNNKFGLPYSNITGKKNGSIPRGCALAWSVRYMNAFAPDEAKKIWKGYKNYFYTTLFGLHGFREWPKGVNLGMDSDSGPIINGIGITASAFGLVAAKILDDKTVYQQLQYAHEQMEDILETSFLSKLSKVPSFKGVKKVYQSNLAKAVLFYEASLN